jgi:starvation-inducible outer membrane lipoprotein
MKNISIIAWAVVLTACATHPMRCRGALQPINAQARPASNSQPNTSNGKPAASPSEPRQ